MLKLILSPGLSSWQLGVQITDYFNSWVFTFLFAQIMTVGQKEQLFDGRTVENKGKLILSTSPPRGTLSRGPKSEISNLRK